MADRMQQYADWLVANQNKAGTPEFKTVADAYKQLRGQSASAAAPAKPANNNSFSAAFQYGIDQPLENMATTARAVGMEGTAQTLSDLTDAPENYESAANRFINPEKGDTQLFGYGIEYLPRAFVEQVGQYAGSLASRAAGGVGGAIGSQGGSKTAAPTPTSSDSRESCEHLRRWPGWSSREAGAPPTTGASSRKLHGTAGRGRIYGRRSGAAGSAQIIPENLRIFQ